ncbi:MAG: polysaccharide pyruvyl transferase family protein [Clostridia bacterium]|nr:polysaccharide pyruvyl transferase family protein [Clostridia bacterium]
MKIGIITFLHNHNYGSLLQAYALEQVLGDMGHEAVHLDYQPDRAEKLRNLLLSGNSPKLILDGLHKKSIEHEAPEAAEKARLLDAFAREKLHVTVRCKNQKELRAASRPFDCLLAGSDQIWSPVWLNPAYFLSFDRGAGAKKKVAYACSLGVASLPSRKKAGRIRKLTEPFSAVSLREAEGARVLETITGKAYPVMPDPVVLPTLDAWRTFAAGHGQEAEGKTLVYLIGHRPEYMQVLEEQKNTGLLVLPASPESVKSGYPIMQDVSVEGFVGAMLHARRLITDSFHGLQMALLLGVPVTLIRRDADDSPLSKNSRIDQLLRTAGCEGKTEIMPDEQILSVLQLEREKGLGFLRASLS